MAVAPFVVTEPLTSPLSVHSLKVSAVRVEPFMYIENMAVMAVLVPTPVAPLDGLAEDTVRVYFIPPPPPDDAVVVNDTSLPVDVPALSPR